MSNIKNDLNSLKIEIKPAFSQINEKIELSLNFIADEEIKIKIITSVIYHYTFNIRLNSLFWILFMKRKKLN